MSIRHDWYQTEEKVVVTVWLKKAEERNCKISIEENRLLLETNDDYKLELHLFQPINTEKSFYKFLSVKVEITLFKSVGHRWPELTKEKAETKPTVVNIYSKDWDSLAKTIEKEKAEVNHHIFSHVFTCFLGK